MKRKSKANDQVKVNRKNNRSTLEPLIRKLLEVCGNNKATSDEKALGTVIACATLSMFSQGKILEIRDGITKLFSPPAKEKKEDGAPADVEKLQQKIKKAMEGVIGDPLTTPQNIDERVRGAIDRVTEGSGLSVDVATIGGARKNTGIYGTPEANRAIYEAAKKCMESNSLADNKCAKVLAILGLARSCGMVDRVIKDLNSSEEVYHHLADILAAGTPQERKKMIEKKLKSPEIDDTIKKQLMGVLKNIN